jgi:hypothetical protein
MLLVLAGLLFAAFVWPTLYRYERYYYGYNSSTIVRINRITGTAEFLSTSGWSKAITIK